MAITLREALEETTKGWQSALPDPWRQVFNGVTLDATAVPTWLKHHPWVPIFPVFRHQATGEIFHASPSPAKGANLVGVPPFAHTFRAFLVPPVSVRVVVVGQDPYPDISDATGQSFEQGSIADWVADSRRVAGSLKPILQLAAAAATGEQRYRVPWTGWDALTDDISSGKVRLAPPSMLFAAYQKQGILWLNTTLTISHFRVTPEGQPSGFQEAHAAYWKPFVSRLFEHVVSQGPGNAVVFALFGSWAKSFKKVISDAAETAGNGKAVEFVETGHPVTNSFLEREKNPFEEIDEKLARLGQKPIHWLPLG